MLKMPTSPNCLEALPNPARALDEAANLLRGAFHLRVEWDDGQKEYGAGYAVGSITKGTGANASTSGGQGRPLRRPWPISGPSEAMVS